MHSLGCKSKYSNTQHHPTACAIGRTALYTEIPRNVLIHLNVVAGICAVLGDSVAIVEVNNLVRLV